MERLSICVTPPPLKKKKKNSKACLSVSTLLFISACLFVVYLTNILLLSKSLVVCLFEGTKVVTRASFQLVSKRRYRRFASFQLDVLSSSVKGKSAQFEFEPPADTCVGE